MIQSPRMWLPFLAFITSFLLSLVCGYPAMMLARRLNLLDIPGSAPHKTHDHPTPLAGGISILLALGAMAFLFRQWLSHDMMVVLTGAGIIFLFGLWDDHKGLSAAPKLSGQFIASIILISSGVQVHFLNIFSLAGYFSSEITQILNVIITLFWLIGITNALNMIDSMDGIAAGLGVIAFAFYLAATQLAGQSTLALWSAIVLGICVALYFWNGLKAKFFLGDSGSQTIGFLLASFGIMYNPLNRSPESSWIVPIMLLGVPIFDTTLVVLSRIRRRQRIGSGRRDHTYHRLISLGFPPKYAVLGTHLAALIISCLAYATLYLPPIITLTSFFTTLVCGLLLLFWLERKPPLDIDIPSQESDHA